MDINIISCKYGYYLSNVLKYILEKENYKVFIKEYINLNDNNLHIILFSKKIKKYPKNYIIYNLEQKDISKWINKKFELSILFSKKSWDYSNLNINKFEKIIQNKLIYFRLPCIDYKLIDSSASNIIEFDIQNNFLRNVIERNNIINSREVSHRSGSNSQIQGFLVLCFTKNLYWHFKNLKPYRFK